MPIEWFSVKLFRRKCGAKEIEKNKKNAINQTHYKIFLQLCS